MKIGRKEDIDVADEMISNLVSCRSRNYAQSVHLFAVYGAKKGGLG